MSFEFNERACLGCDPFDGDFGGGGQWDRILSDKIVTCRKRRKCHICAGFTTKRTRIRSRVEVYDNEMMRFAWCNACCAAMASYDGDADSELERRYSIGHERRAKARSSDEGTPAAQPRTGGE